MSALTIDRIAGALGEALHGLNLTQPSPMASSTLCEPQP